MNHSPNPDPAALAPQLPANCPLPPVERWNPPFSGEMDLYIARNGVWFHEGVPIQREALVRLFARILRRDVDDYYLVTPVEKWRIRVEDAPFLAVRLDVFGADQQRHLTFTTNVGDLVVAGPNHPLSVEYRTPGGEPSPYLHVRGRLRALLTRAVFLELAELGEERLVEGARQYGVWSQGCFFLLGHLDNDD